MFKSKPFCYFYDFLGEPTRELKHSIQCCRTTFRYSKNVGSRR